MSTKFKEWQAEAARKACHDELEKRPIQPFEDYYKGERLFIKGSTETALKIMSDERLKQIESALEMYAMSNEAFPEYGNVARATLEALREMIKEYSE